MVALGESPESEAERRIAEAAQSGKSELDLSGLRLTEVPGSIGTLTYLEMLRLDDNQLVAVPESIGRLSKLVSLSLSDNKLARIPHSIGQLRSLATLYLDYNQLAEVPESIGRLPRLTTLFLDHNRLSRIPESIGLLSGLTSLSLGANLLTAVPESISGLVELTTLYLEGNQLTRVPESLARLVRLTSLSLSGNRFTELPVWIGRLPRLRKLRVSDNPELTSPPPEVVAQGDEAVLAFLQACARSSSELWNSKVLIVGEATVGKTSLTKCLRGEAFDASEGQTHGLRVRRLEMPHPHRQGVEMNLDLWDFGGQLEYRATQRFYLTDRSLFILVWNSRARWPDGKIVAWLDAITARAPRSPILVVATHGDEHSPAALPMDLVERYPRIVGALTVDSRTGTGIEEIREAMARHASALPLMGIRWPTAWSDAAQAVRDLPGLTATTHRVFKAMAEAGVVNGDEQQAIARALHDLGQVAYFADVPDLAAKVILKPDWLDARITQVIDSQAVADAGGMLSRDERYRLWGDLIASEDDPDLLDRLLRMMESFDLAYRIGDAQDSEDVALIVDRLPESRPGDIERMWRENAAGPGMREIGIIYKLASRQAGIPSWFIAREHRYTTELHWRNGVLLHDRDPRFPAWALLVDDGREQPTITLRVAGPYPVRFLSVLTEALDNIVDHRYPGLIEEMLVPCACENENGLRCVNAFTLEELLAEATAEEPDADHKVRCSKSRRRIEATVMLDGLRGTGLTAELDAIRDRLDGQSSTLNAIEAAHQRGINSLRILLEDRAHAGAHCPALFSITPGGRSHVPRFERFILSLWCEWPDGPHILDDDAGRYTITKVPAALTRYLPYLRHLITALGLVTPGLASAGIELSTRAQAGIEAATKTLEYVDKYFAVPSQTELDALPATVAARQTQNGADFRALRNMLRDLDPREKWGGLSPTVRPEDQRVIYLCPQHFHELGYPYNAA